MEDTITAAVTFRTLWISGSFIVGIIVWVYKLWYDTKLNKEEIIKLKREHTEEIEKIKSEHKAFREQIHTNIDRVKDEMRLEFKKFSKDIEEFFEKHEKRELEDSRLLSDKLERMMMSLTEIKVDLAKKVDK
jgi:hypothetical protein